MNDDASRTNFDNVIPSVRDFSAVGDCIIRHHPWHQLLEKRSHAFVLPCEVTCLTNRRVVVIGRDYLRRTA